MLWVPSKGKVRVQHNLGGTGAGSKGTLISAAGTNTAFGSVTQMIASTNFDAFWITIALTKIAASATASQTVFNLYTGAATEELVIDSLLCGHSSGDIALSGKGPIYYSFPLYIPAGTRISGAFKSVRVGVGAYAAIWLYGGNEAPPFQVANKITSYGTPGASSLPRGTAITPGTSGAEGSWTQVVASSAIDHFAIVPGFQVATDTTMTNSTIALDIGIGGAGAEAQISEGWIYHVDQTECMGGPLCTIPCFRPIPAGTRLACRASNSVATNDAAYDCALYACS